MLFKKKKPEVIHKDYCSRCKTTEDLMKYTKQTSPTGVTTQYYMCRPCNADRHKKWYYDGNQEKAQKLNENWRKNK